MAYDGTGTVLFGGTGSSGVVSDTWYWNGSSWTKITTGLLNTPQARTDAAIAYDPASGRVVMFGGGCSLPLLSCNLNDTWTWNPATKTWTQVQANTLLPLGNQPGQRTGARMALDSAGHLILFGGSNGSTSFNDTWKFNGTGWTQLVANGSAGQPTARYDAGMARDSGGTVVLFGGTDGSSAFKDTWRWNGSVWTAVSVTGPSARSAPAVTACGGTSCGASVLVLFGGADGAGNPLGDSWGWSGSAWTLLSVGGGATGPVARSAAAATADGSGAMLIFGGSGASGLLNDTWSL
jgi:hypothetical protein